MTGRREPLRPQVQSILEEYGVCCDLLILNSGGDTLSYKCAQLRRLAAAMPLLREVLIWEDRADHAEQFANLGAASFAHIAWRVETVGTTQRVDTRNLGAAQRMSMVTLLEAHL